MSVVLVVLPLALLLVGAAVAAWVWAARSGQFDDTETPAARVLVDDVEPGSGPGEVESRDQRRAVTAPGERLPPVR